MGPGAEFAGRGQVVKFDPRILPTILIVIDVFAAVGYFADGGLGEWRKVVYWVSAATLTYAVTW